MVHNVRSRVELGIVISVRRFLLHVVNCKVISLKAVRDTFFRQSS